jgi:NAD(P)-dependent dehydrogenase (short-subunit alcohol dehydrogenase family)
MTPSLHSHFHHSCISLTKPSPDIQARAEAAKAACPGAESVLIADLSSIAETKKLAEQVNQLGRFDVVIHNAGVYRGPFKKTTDGFATTFAVNTLAPYILTCLITKPKRLVYVSSGLHRGGDPSTYDLTWAERGPEKWDDAKAYASSKLHNVLLAGLVARKWPAVSSNSLDPGWVPTKMGGQYASGDIKAAVETYSILAEDEKAAKGVTGKYFVGSEIDKPIAAATDVEVQDQLLKELEKISGVSLPA